MHPASIGTQSCVRTHPKSPGAAASRPDPGLRGSRSPVWRPVRDWHRRDDQKPRRKVGRSAACFVRWPRVPAPQTSGPQESCGRPACKARQEPPHWFGVRVGAGGRVIYNSIIANRNGGARGRPVRMALGDMAVWHEGAKEVPGAFEGAPALRPESTCTARDAAALRSVAPGSACGPSFLPASGAAGMRRGGQGAGACGPWQSGRPPCRRTSPRCLAGLGRAPPPGAPPPGASQTYKAARPRPRAHGNPRIAHKGRQGPQPDAKGRGPQEGRHQLEAAQQEQLQEEVCPRPGPLSRPEQARAAQKAQVAPTCGWDGRRAHARRASSWPCPRRARPRRTLTCTICQSRGLPQAAARQRPSRPRRRARRPCSSCRTCRLRTS